MPTFAGRAARLLRLDRSDLIAWSVRLRGAFPHQGYREHHRVPLWHPKVPFVLLTSQKAGSTLGTAWFFHHADLLREARAHDDFVHHYEQDVFLRRDAYFEGLEEALRTKPVLKLVREPGARAFSSYMALHTTEALGRRDHRSSIRRKIARHAGLRNGADGPIPFRAFLSWVAETDHQRLDGHEARQTNLYEDNLPSGPPQPIKLEEASKALPAIEAKFDLPISSQSQLQGFGASTHYVPKSDDSGLADIVMTEGLPLPRRGKAPRMTTKVIAQYPDAYTDLKRAYGEDYRRYGYPLAEEME